MLRVLEPLIPHRVAFSDALVGPLWTLALVALAFLLLHGLLRRWCRPRRIQAPAFRARTVGREIVLSAGTMVVSGLTGIGSLWLAERGYIRVGFTNAPATVALQLGLYFLCFDLYFYWTHRFFHRPLPYRWIHCLHHRSTAPNPLTAFAIHPLEAVVQAAFLPLFLWLVPLQLATVLIVSVIAPVNSILLHSGHELFPRWWYRLPVSAWYATPLFHDLHHTSVTWNYGAFTTVWDHVFGTVKPGFAGEFALVKARSMGPRSGPRFPSRTG
jgi:lathosterol oxidase